MEKVETQSEEAHVINGELATILRVLSRPDTRLILHRAGQGIENSTYAIEELNLTPKKYYTRLRELMDSSLIKKKDDVYRQTSLGKIICGHFLPAMERACEAKNELGILDDIEGTEINPKVRQFITDKLGLPGFAGSSNVRIDDYESMVVDVIDLFDKAEESILMASNHLDVRVLDAAFRSIDRGVNNRFIIGRAILSSKLQQLKMILSPKFAKAMMDFTFKPTDMNEMARVIDIPYSFCVVDGHLSLIEISNAQVSFIAAFHVKNRGLGNKLTNLFETLWKAGESYSPLKFLSSF